MQRCEKCIHAKMCAWYVEADNCAYYKTAADFTSKSAFDALGDIETVVNNYVKAVDPITLKSEYCNGAKQAFDTVLKFISELKKKYKEEDQ